MNDFNTFILHYMQMCIISVIICNKLLYTETCFHKNYHCLHKIYNIIFGLITYV